ncbi:MAG: hypothetical protein COV52_09550 [Gammaproteobacteria bacterium CG11_big_fil_rev_8_21_14_0_20_46_22]|nr:MAG: hypothetical protein COW05_03660 [Gammaproteobacteria bacterium CG12_big_fil_rev_8_21_14_0_65_46_12]PIR10292.1 MAG: hypothetical protein COV52_09550 [Gammaproteobacteria bacterium CG11_big_fil_rev_8_21_14_0_20_46_22]
MKKFYLSSFFLLASSLGHASILSIKHWQTSGGTPVYYTDSNAAPMLNIVVQFNAGSAFDKQNPGVSALSNTLLTKGTEKLSNQAFSDAVDSLGSSIETSSDKERAIIALQSLKQARYLSPTLTLFKQALSSPAFRQTDIEITKQQFLASYAMIQQQAESKAALDLSTALFKGTPYAHDEIGTPASIKRITQQNIRTFYTQHYTQKNAAIFMVGDISENQAKTISNTLLSALPKGKHLAPAKLTAPLQARLIHSAFDSNQTYIYLATRFDSKDQNRYTLQLANYLLGQGPNSLLFELVRGKEGLTYTPSSTVDQTANQLIWIINLQTANVTTQAALRQTKKAMQQLASKGPDPRALAAAKQFLSRSLPLRFTSNGKILNTQVYLYNHALPLNYFDHYADNINKVTANDIQAVAARYLNPKKMVLLTLGGQ